MSRLYRLQLFTLFFAVAASGGVHASTWSEGFKISFQINRSLMLRDNKLEKSGVVTSDSVVTIDPDFLEQNLGSHQPSSEQIKEFFANPNRFSNNKVDAQLFFDSNSQTWRSDYFFPVQVKKADGSIAKGQMALSSAFRMGHTTIKMEETPQARTTATQEKSLKIYLHNEDPTQVSASARLELESQTQGPPLIPSTHDEDSVSEGQVCVLDCPSQANSSHNGPMQAIVIPKAEVQASQSLRWEKYSEFAKDFSEKFGKKINSNSARMYKRLFVRSLINKFGPEEAGYMVQALTAFGESADRPDDNAQLAELAAVTRVIENRAQTNASRKSRVLRDIGVSQNRDTRLSAALANGQFSVWNDGDNNLSRILAFHPEKSNPMVRRRMSMAFEAQEMMNNQEITFVGQMANPMIQHYHADYTRPKWASSSKRIQQAVVRIKDDGQYVNVDLAQQSGSRHLFYAGVR